MNERDIVFLTIIFITAVWAISATLIATHLTGRRSIIAWIIDDVRRGLRRKVDAADALPAKPESHLKSHTFDVPEEQLHAMLAEQRRLRDRSTREIMARQSKGASPR